MRSLNNRNTTRSVNSGSSLTRGLSPSSNLSIAPVQAANRIAHPVTSVSTAIQQTQSTVNNTTNNANSANLLEADNAEALHAYTQQQQQ